jgi:hypothetical protein
MRDDLLLANDDASQALQAIGSGTGAGVPALQARDPSLPRIGTSLRGERNCAFS